MVGSGKVYLGKFVEWLVHLVGFGRRGKSRKGGVRCGGERYGLVRSGGIG